jgi:hypothetical protein
MKEIRELSDLVHEQAGLLMGVIDNMTDALVRINQTTQEVETKSIAYEALKRMNEQAKVGQDKLRLAGARK